MTTRVTVENHGGFKLEVTFENKMKDGSWLRSHSQIIEPEDKTSKEFTIWDGKRLIVQEI